MPKIKKIIVPTEEEIIRIHNYLVAAHKGLAGKIQSPGYISDFCKNYLTSEGLATVLGFMLSRLSKGHYFVDGNKRTAYFTGKYAALRNGYDFNGTSPDKIAEEMDTIVTLDDPKSRAYATKLVERDLTMMQRPLESIVEYERLVLKGIAVSNLLSQR